MRPQCLVRPCDLRTMEFLLPLKFCWDIYIFLSSLLILMITLSNQSHKAVQIDTHSDARKRLSQWNIHISVKTTYSVFACQCTFICVLLPPNEWTCQRLCWNSKNDLLAIRLSGYLFVLWRIENIFLSPLAQAEKYILLPDNVKIDNADVCHCLVSSTLICG